MNLTNGSNSTVYSTLLFVVPNPDQGFAENVLFTLCSLFLISVALSSNLFIVASLLKKSPITASHHLVINLCFADIVKCLLFFVIFNAPVLCGSWRLGTWPCKTLPGLYFGVLTISVCILSFLAHDRYNAIARPLTHNMQTIAKTYGKLACYWMIIVGGFVGTTVTPFQVHIFEGEVRCSHLIPRTGSPSSNMMQGLFVQFLFGFLFTHLEFLFYYVKIRRLLRANSKRFSENNAAATSQRIERNKRATNTVLASVLAYDFIMAPSIVLVMVGTAYADFAELSVLREWGQLWLLLYGCVNPMLFIWRNGELKSALKSFVKKMRK